MRIQDQIIIECVKKGQGNLTLAFIEASVQISLRDDCKSMTIDSVKERWYKSLKNGKRIFSTSYDGMKCKNLKNIVREVHIGYSASDHEAVQQLKKELS